MFTPEAIAFALQHLGLKVAKTHLSFRTTNKYYVGWMDCEFKYCIIELIESNLQMH